MIMADDEEKRPPSNGTSREYHSKHFPEELNSLKSCHLNDQAL